MSQEFATGVFGGGCFWCTEAVFLALEGVQSVESGYSGGVLENPSYEQVCNMDTGHIEVVRIKYDPTVISFDSLLDVFFATHDPTTPNQQGNDIGPQYQSVIFWQTEDQRDSALEMIAQLENSGRYAESVCTKVLPAQKFWIAENYHQRYFELHPNQGYCQFVIAPKVVKFREQFAGKLKKA